MAQVTFKGDPVQTVGDLPAIGSVAPGFALVDSALGEAKLSDYAGKQVVLNIFPSIDTPVCAASVKRFNTEAAALENTVVLCVSVDLPFAQGRFCGAENIGGVHTLSAFRDHAFGQDYGVLIKDTALMGLFARAVVVIGADGKVVYTELVPEIAEEPNYDAALSALG